MIRKKVKAPTMTRAMYRPIFKKDKRKLIIIIMNTNDVGNLT